MEGIGVRGGDTSSPLRPTRLHNGWGCARKGEMEPGGQESWISHEAVVLNSEDVTQQLVGVD